MVLRRKVKHVLTPSRERTTKDTKSAKILVFLSDLSELGGSKVLSDINLRKPCVDCFMLSLEIILGVILCTQ